MKVSLSVQLLSLSVSAGGVLLALAVGGGCSADETSGATGGTTTTGGAGGDAAAGGSAGSSAGGATSSGGSTSSGGGGAGGPEPLFFDDFESGDLSHSDNGIGWTNQNAGDGDEVAISSDIVHSGSHALRFHFAGGADGDDAFAEQRFTLGEARAEIYVSFYAYFPDGDEPGENRYVHRDSTGPDNNKLLRVWAPDYDGFKWGASFRPEAEGSRIFGETRVGSCGEGVGGLPSTSWPMTAGELGRWLHLELHVRGDDGSGNGAYALWVDGTSQISATDIQIPGAPCSPNHFIAGYLMGWANSGFDQDTNVYIDDVAFALSHLGP